MTENHEFNRIYEKYKNPILRVAYIRVKDLDIAEDIMQETFLRLLRLMGQSEEIRNIESWLFVTAKHLALNYCKKVMKWEVRTDDIVLQDESEEPFEYEPPGESAEEAYLEEALNRQKAELHDRVMAGLIEKNRRWHDALLLEAHMEMPQKEAAKTMNMSLNAYQVMLHRAREWIRETYGVEYEEMKQK